MYILSSAPCKGNTLIIRLLPLQGVGGVWAPFTQGAALGYVLLPLRGVLFMSFDTPSIASNSTLRQRRYRLSTPHIIFSLNDVKYFLPFGFTIIVENGAFCMLTFVPSCIV